MPVIKEISESSSSGTTAIVRSMMTLPDGKWAGIPLRMFFSVCDNAACGCTDLAISLAPDGKPDSADSVRFTVDVGDKELAEKDKDNKSAKDIAGHFDKQDWYALWRTFMDIKLQYTENLDLEGTFAKFPMQNAIETEGELVAYSEILPHGRKFFAESSEGTILLDEQYCLRRGCDCDQVVVCFVPIKDGKQSGESAMSEVRYRTGKVASSTDLGSFTQTPQELFKVFLGMYPDLLEQFSKRHKQLTHLYSNYRKSQSMTARREVSKVGRNDLCPCGSGKKYKKCCAIKQLEAEL